jgi:positive regulator of sigma E activity
MTQPTQEPLNNKDKIQILLHEYGTLRTEIIHRTNNLYQLLAVGGALFVWLMGHAVDRRFWISLAVSLPLLCLGFGVIRRYINKTAKRLREIEKTVNSLAGLELMVWETLWAGGVTGYFARSLSPLERTTEEERPTDTSGL